MLSKLLVNEILSNGEYYTALSTSSDNQYHSHEFIEIFYVVSGSAIQELNDEKQLIKTGDVFIMKPTDYHRFISSETSTIFLHRDICIKLDEFDKICNFLNLSSADFLNSKIAQYAKLKTDTITSFETFFKSYASYENTDLLNRICKSVSTMILIDISNNNETSKNLEMPDWIRQIVDYAKSPYYYNNGIEKLTENIPYSKQHICNMFKKYVGMSITEYFLQQRLNYAKYLLLSTTNPISDIAYETGFANPSFFYRTFKKHFNFTPLDLRKKGSYLSKSK